MEIQSASGQAVYSYLNISSRQKRDPANATAGSAASTANPAYTVAISGAARDLFAAQANSAPTLGSGTTALFDTDQGSIKLDIDTYFSPDPKTNGAATSLQSLPPLLLPSRKNIAALTSHISGVFPQFLAANNIPAAPASITYDSAGQMQLPPDYPYAAEFKEALANNPTLDRELRAVNALTSHLVEMEKAIPFNEEYAAATTQAEINAIVAKYSYLFAENKQYSSIALNFSASGELSLSADGKPLSQRLAF